MAWTGNGWLVAVCNALGFGLAFAITNFALRLPDPTHAAVLIALWSVFSAVGIFFWNRALASKTEARVLIDADTGRRHEIAAEVGTFSGIPVRWWSLINVVVGVGFAAAVGAGLINLFD